MLVFSFTPKNDAEINAIQNRELLTEGAYAFIVKDITEEISKSNNPMLKVRIGVIDSMGSERNITDYLLTTDTMIFKLKHFCDTLGLEEDYKKGIFDLQKAIGREGNVMVGIQKGSIKESGGFYPDKNTVKDYVKVSKAVQNKSVVIDPLLNQDIPF